MAMTTCKECRHPISNHATACPSCGAQPFNGNSVKRIAGLLYLLVLVAAFYGVWRLLSA